MSTPVGEIHVLGQVVARTAHGPVPLAGARTRELLAALAVPEQCGSRRDQICASIWPESSHIAARKALNTELWRLRAAIRDAGGDSEEWIESTARTVRLRPENGVDVDLSALRTALRIEEGADPAALLLAIDLYRGDFAEGLNAEWITGTREQVHREFVRGLERAVDGFRRAELYDKAAVLAERLVEEEPFDERGHRALLLIRIQNGDHASAVRHYQDLRRTFRAELGIDPSPETRALVEELFATARSPQSFGFEEDPPRSDPPASVRGRLAALRSTAEHLLQQIERIQDALGDSEP